jgi:hypothetical protein
VDPRDSLDRALRCDVPPEAIALYARWWQLEGWLRQLAYFVLRSAWGVTWEEEIQKKARKFLTNDNLAHLSGPDSGDLLAYLDFSLLLKLIEGQWDLFEPFLLPKGIWLGRCEEFGTIRNRIAHLRRPADRDLERVETALADIEQGYREAWRAVSTAVEPGDRPADPVIQDYRTGEIRALIGMARSRYGRYALEFSLRISQMPWATAPDPPEPLAGTPGLFWHLECGGPDIWVWPRDYRDSLPPDVREALAFTLMPSPMGATFAGSVVDDPATVVLGLAGALRAFLGAAVPSARILPGTAGTWAGRERDMEPHVLVAHPFALQSYPDTAGSVFAVQKGNRLR